MADQLGWKPDGVTTGIDLNGGGMTDPTILHLTDLHFGWDGDSAKAVAQISGFRSFG